MEQDPAPPASELPTSAGSGASARWWRWMELRVGIVPLPIFLLLTLLVGAFLYLGVLPNEINVWIAVLALFGFGCAEVGRRMPLLRNIGGAAIFATFVPSFLVYHHLLPEAIAKGVADFTKSTNFLYLFIAAIIVGSVLGMDRSVLIKGFLKIFVPLAVGSLAGAAVGTMVGAALGLGVFHTFYYVVIPIMAGGVGEGAIPLSLGYAGILHQPQGEIFAEVLPSVMVGSLTAILLSGALNYLGRRYPHLTGEGRLQPGAHEEISSAYDDAGGNVDVGNIAAAGITAMALYLVGLLGYKLLGFPAPVTMLFAAVVVKLTHAVPPSLQKGSFVVYKFFSTAVTYPLLFAIGVTMTPWDKLVSAFSPANLATIVATVATLVASGFFIGRRMHMYPIDTAIVTACHSGQGGTGDVAILTAGNRMALMPFAQIATRIGGAITVTLALLAMSRLA